MTRPPAKTSQKIAKAEPARPVRPQPAAEVTPGGVPAVYLPGRSPAGLPPHPTARRLRQASVIWLQRRRGNAHVQRLLSRPMVQRTPDEGQADQVAETPGAAATAAVTTSDPEAWDRLVEAKLEQFLTEFQNIPVTVRWEEAGETKTETVTVHPPYFINTKKFEASKKRLERAEKARKKATGSTEKAPVKASWRALHGKTSKEEFQTILQKAVDDGKVPTPEGKKHPDSSDLRAWLVKYGIGVDCSGFVSYALNEVMAEVYAQAGVSTEGLKQVWAGSGGLKGGQGDFAKVSRPGDLKPGDTMHIPGHIRIVMGVRETENGVEFTTAESRSGTKDGMVDIGIDRNVWLYKDADKFTGLKKESGGKWVKQSSAPTYGRYKALEKFEAENVPPTPAAEEAPTAGGEAGAAAGAGATGAGATGVSATVGGLVEGLVEGAQELLADVGEAVTGAAESVVETAGEWAAWIESLWGDEAPAGGGPAPPVAAPVEPGQAALAAAIADGNRDVNRLTDIVFHARRPERGGKGIDPAAEAGLVEEWKAIRDDEVRPALARAAEKAPAGEGEAPTGGDGAKHYSLKSGVSLTASVEARVAEIANLYYDKTSKDLVVTSGTRSAVSQAGAMYTKLELGDDIVSLYRNKTAVKAIKKAYDDGKAAGKGAAAIKADMTAVIQGQIERGVFISSHLKAGAVDIRSRDLSAADKTAFGEACAAVKGVRMIEETKPPHFHLEIK